MDTPEADKKTLAQASGIPTKTEALVQKACKNILALPDATIAKRGCEPGDCRRPPRSPRTTATSLLS
jgi:hypothetical protein